MQIQHITGMKIERIDINDPNFNQKKLDNLVDTFNDLVDYCDSLEQSICEL